MIADAIIGFIADVIRSFLEVCQETLQTALDGLPEVPTLDLSEFASDAGTVFFWANWIDQYVPLWHAIAVSIVFMSGWVVFYAIDIGVWFGTKLHFLGGDSH